MFHLLENLSLDVLPDGREVEIRRAHPGRHRSPLLASNQQCAQTVQLQFVEGFGEFRFPIPGVS